MDGVLLKRFSTPKIWVDPQKKSFGENSMFGGSRIHKYKPEKCPKAECAAKCVHPYFLVIPFLFCSSNSFFFHSLVVFSVHMCMHNAA